MCSTARLVCFYITAEVSKVGRRVNERVRGPYYRPAKSYSLKRAGRSPQFSIEGHGKHKGNGKVLEWATPERKERGHCLKWNSPVSELPKQGKWCSISDATLKNELGCKVRKGQYKPKVSQIMTKDILRYMYQRKCFLSSTDKLCIYQKTLDQQKFHTLCQPLCTRGFHFGR